MCLICYTKHKKTLQYQYRVILLLLLGGSNGKDHAFTFGKNLEETAIIRINVPKQG